jgi:hypothetical protein
MLEIDSTIGFDLAFGQSFHIHSIAFTTDFNGYSTASFRILCLEVSEFECQDSSCFA